MTDSIELALILALDSSKKIEFKHGCEKKCRDCDKSKCERAKNGR